MKILHIQHREFGVMFPEFESDNIIEFLDHYLISDDDTEWEYKGMDIITDEHILYDVNVFDIVIALYLYWRDSQPDLIDKYIYGRYEFKPSPLWYNMTVDEIMDGEYVIAEVYEILVQSKFQVPLD